MTVVTEEPLPDTCWPVDVSCVEGWAAANADQRAFAVALAGETMRLLTGYRVGGCPVMVRPCLEWCGERPPTWGTSRTALPWRPVVVGGTWLNVPCGCTTACGCTTLAAIHLPAGASSVTEVLIDGVVLNPTAYRLDPGGLLWRTDGDAWPLRQDLSAPVTAPGTFAVSYVPGAAVDGLGARAAGILAGEYLTACAGGECRLPQGVTQVVRQGVTMTLTPGTFPNGRTGIQAVDVYLERWNPHGLASPSVVASPDRRRAR